jgi:TPR repeat protein
MGDPAGCTFLGMLYSDGIGVAQDGRRAADLFERACLGGNAAGCLHLAIAYESGRGIRTDAVQARRWYEQACRGGASQACRAIGRGTPEPKTQ